MVQSGFTNNDGSLLDIGDREIHCAKFHRFLPAGQTASGNFRQDPLIQFFEERMVYNGREMFGKQRTVSTMSVIQIKGITMDKVHEVVSKHQAVEEKPKLKIRRRKQLSGGGH